MTTRNWKPSIFYTNGTPVRWLRAAAAMLDESLATLCRQQWRGTQLAVVEARNTQHLRRRLR